MTTPICGRALPVIFIWVALVSGCSEPSVKPSLPAPVPPQALRPDRGVIPPASDQARPSQTAIDLTQPGAVVWGSTPAEIIDTTTHAPLIDEASDSSPRRVREILPAHEFDEVLPVGETNSLPVGRTLDRPRATPTATFPGIGQTGWVPPDPTLAVGPNHILTTVNMRIAWYTKSGTLEYANELNDGGNPGFFETVGAGGFTFDPKCFYDHLAQRFVVVAPEVYGETEAWITFAVSDDANPNGTWYKYRTDAVITVGGTTFWWDYPGFGYDEDAYYVTSNLFGLNQGGWGGVGFRVFQKAPLLTGAPTVYATMRDGGSASVQVAQHFGDNPAPYFVSMASSSAVRIHAIRNPITSPSLVSTDVTVPPHSGPGGAPVQGGGAVSLIDARIMNAHWRGGNLYAGHNISSGGRNFARWYHIDTGNWPNSGSPTFLEAGNVDAGADVHTFFPAIYSTQFGEVGMVVGASSASTRVSVNVTGRLPADPPGTMGALTQVKLSTADTNGRWGDYYDIAVDPVDDETFWVIGEYSTNGGWATWISSFRITPPGPVAVNDQTTTLLSEEQIVVDVMANDYHGAGLAFDISSFDAVSAHGGTIHRSNNTGPGGRDELVYTAPIGFSGDDTFSYTISDIVTQTSTATVTVPVLDTSSFRDPENPIGTAAGLNAAYYVLSVPVALPDFSFYTPYATDVVPELNYGATNGDFATSGRASNLGAVFEGYVAVPATDLYTFYTESDDGSALYIGDTLVVDNDGLHGMQEAAGQIGLKAGLHAVRVEFFESGGAAGLIARIAGGGLPKQVIPGSLWSHASCLSDVDHDG
ncbi:MAG: hypothetical protein KDA63_20160, partial [Planctomycetales bacterium]|nr:hypothetical protein [Planctomycetales bacterium]